MKPRIVFMGSPEFALPSLRALAKNHALVGVVTQPDRPAGRGRQLKPPPIKTLAEELNLPLIQPRRLTQPEAMEQLQAWKPDLIVVVAFGQILRPKVLDFPPFGALNVHASLLPRWRGAAPIQAAILHGDDHTGVTIMRMDAGVDTGPLLNQRAESIHPDDTAGTLSNRLAALGADLLLETLPPYLRGDLQPKPQDDSLATLAPMLKKEDGRLDPHQPAADLARHVRAFQPWPGAFIQVGKRRIKVHRAHALSSKSKAPGHTLVHDGFPALETAEGLLVLDKVQPAGKKVMSGDTFLRGARDWGEKLLS